MQSDGHLLCVYAKDRPQEIYLVETSPNPEGIPSNWTKSGGTKVNTHTNFTSSISSEGVSLRPNQDGLSLVYNLPSDSLKKPERIATPRSKRLNFGCLLSSIPTERYGCVPLGSLRSLIVYSASQKLRMRWESLSAGQNSSREMRRG